jgi:hypothetical protein
VLPAHAWLLFNAVSIGIPIRQKIHRLAAEILALQTPSAADQIAVFGTHHASAALTTNKITIPPCAFYGCH